MSQNYFMHQRSINIHIAEFIKMCLMFLTLRYFQKEYNVESRFTLSRWSLSKDERERAKNSVENKILERIFYSSEFKSDFSSPFLNFFYFLNKFFLMKVSEYKK